MLPRLQKLFLIALFTGCARLIPEAGPAPSPKGEVSEPTEISRKNSGRSWLIVPATRPQRYNSTITTTVELLSDQGIIRDSLRRKMTFSLLTATASGSTSFLGSVEAASSEAGARMGRGSEVLSVLPLTFTGHTTGINLIVDALSDRTGNLNHDCSSPALSTLQTVHRNVFTLPTPLVSGATWTDSITFSGCSGAIPTKTVSVRVFQVLSEAENAGQQALLLKATGHSLSSGEGTEGQHRVLVQSEGTESAHILIDRTTGALLDWNGQEKTLLTVKAGYSQRFTQTVHVRTMAER